MSCGLDLESNNLFEALTQGEDFDIPSVDLSDDAFKFPFGPDSAIYKPIAALTVAELTTMEPGGAGVFDVLMLSQRNHLREEYEKDRITGAEYSKAYIALTEQAMQAAVQFLLNRDQSFWQAQQAQIQAITARVQFETAKVQLASVQMEAQSRKADYALTKSKLGTESVNYCIANYNLNSILPSELAQNVQQTLNLKAEGEAQRFTIDMMMPQQYANLTSEGRLIDQRVLSETYNLSDMLPAQVLNVKAETSLTTARSSTEVINNNIANYNLNQMLPMQRAVIIAQEKLVNEQHEVQRAQTLDYRGDGNIVVGVLGKQKDLYAQQIVSYKRNSEVAAAKLFTDAWITQKTIDEGLLPPDGFSNAEVNKALIKLQQENGFV